MSGEPENTANIAKATHHFGRGGAGNITAKDSKSPSLPPSQTPTLKSKNYTTGRGGTGNIVENKDPETARLAQDVDVPGISLPENTVHTGRGGGGNVYRPTEDEAAAHRQNNENLRKTSFSNKDKSALQSIKDKAKSVLSSKDKEKETGESK